MAIARLLVAGWLVRQIDSWGVEGLAPGRRIRIVWVMSAGPDLPGLSHARKDAPIDASMAHAAALTALPSARFAGCDPATESASAARAAMGAATVAGGQLFLRRRVNVVDAARRARHRALASAGVVGVQLAVRLA